jgi:CheY-like chemotaxis protein
MDQGHILYVEDGRDDVQLLNHALQAADVDACTSVVQDGDEAISYLAGEREFADRTRYPLPELIILDWSLRRVSGLEVLTWIRQQPPLRRVTVLVFTYSSRPHDVRAAQEAGADGYHVKDVGWEKTIEFARTVKGVLQGRLQAQGQFLVEH